MVILLVMKDLSKDTRAETSLHKITAIIFSKNNYEH